MPSGTGLGATWGIGRETTFGTSVAPTRWFEFTSEGFGLTREAVQGQGIRGGGTYGNRANRRVVTAVGTSGSIAGQLPTRGLGVLLQAMTGDLGLIAQQGATTAYQHVYKMGDLDGKSFTVQKKVPQTDGTGNTFTYNGCKATGWEVACSAGEIATVSVDFDGVNESTATAYTAAVYPTDSGVFSFKDGAIFTGGTVTDSAGVLTHGGSPTQVAAITGVTLTGSNTLKTDRRFFGNNGLKAEQVENGVRAISGSFEGEYVGNTLYNSFISDSQLTVRLTFTSTILAGTGFPCVFEVLLPAVFLSGETPKVGGTDVVPLSIGFDAFETSVSMAQFRVITPDTTP